VGKCKNEKDQKNVPSMSSMEHVVPRREMIQGNAHGEGLHRYPQGGPHGANKMFEPSPIPMALVPTSRNKRWTHVCVHPV
jgi:hypothetical protein